jgi:predicted nucleotidyltransferase
MTSPCPLMSDPIEKKAVELLIELAQPRRLWLFGSRARNQHGEGSDYDFALEEPLLKPEYRWKVTEALEALPTLRHFDVIWLGGASEVLKQAIARDGVCLYER